MTNGRGESDRPVLPAKSPNKVAQAAVEAMEGRGLAKENTSQQNASRTQCRISAPSELARVRQAAKRDKKAKFTALFHHITIDRLGAAFGQLKKHAAAGVDGVTWEQYGGGLEENLRGLHDRLRRGSDDVPVGRVSRAGAAKIVQDRARAENAERQVSRQIDRLLDAYQSGAMSVEELKARRERLEAARAAARVRVEELTALELDRSRLEALAEDLAAFAATLRAGLQNLDFQGRQRLVRLLVERVIVTGTHVAIEHAIPLSGRFRGLQQQRQSATMPTDHRIRLHNREALRPPRPDAREQNPEGANRSKLRTLPLPTKDRELLPQSEILGDEARLRSERGSDRANDCHEELEHGRTLSQSDKIVRRESASFLL